MGANWELSEVSRNVHVVKFEPHKRSKQWEAWVLVQSDEHLDSIYHRADLLKSHHEQAKERNAVVLKLGDVYDAMGGKWDPRGNLSELHPDLRGDDYLDRVVEMGSEVFHPYRENVALLTYGNHETSIRKRHHTDLIDRTATTIRARGGITRAGGYQGWVRFMFCSSKGSHTRSFRLHYDHGWGGGGPVTMGVIDYNRKQARIAAADMIAMGHVHWKNYHPIERVELNDASRIVRSTLHLLRCGTYKDEYGDGSGLGPCADDPLAGSSDFHAGRGQGPRRLGGWWLRFHIQRGELAVDVVEAQ